MTTDLTRIERMIREIQNDIDEGRVPATVATFSELHDYVDANEYGGFCDEWTDDEAAWDLLVEQSNRCQSFVDQWLRAGRPSLRRTLPTGEYAVVWPIEGSRGFQTVFWGSAADYDADRAAYDTSDWSDNATVSISTDTLVEALDEIR